MTPDDQWTDHPGDGRPYAAFLEIAAALGFDRQTVYARAVEIAERTPDEVVPLGALYLRVLAEAIEQPSGADPCLEACCARILLDTDVIGTHPHDHVFHATGETCCQIGRRSRVSCAICRAARWVPSSARS